MKIFSFIRVFSLAILVTALKTACAPSIPDNMGQPLQPEAFTYTEGSPYFINEWDNGTVKMDNGTTFKDVQLKYNDLAGVLYFKDDSGKEMVFTQPVHEFTIYTPKSDTLKEHHFRNGYAASRDPKLFYEVLCDGPVQLLRINLKQGQESEDNSVITHRIITSTQYFLLIANRLVAMKKDRKFIYQNLGNKTREMEDFANKNNLNIKDDRDIIKLINFYNSI